MKELDEFLLQNCSIIEKALDESGYTIVLEKFKHLIKELKSSEIEEKEKKDIFSLLTK